MRKTTFYSLCTLVLCFSVFKMNAQSFPEDQPYRLRTALASPDEYHATKTAPFAGQYVYPTANPGSDALKVNLQDLGSDNQLFEFKPLAGETVEYPVGSGEMEQVYNIVSKAAGSGNGTGVLELNQLGQNGHRIRLRGNAYPFADDLARFIIKPVGTIDGASTYQIVASGTIGAATAANRLAVPDTNYEYFNFGSASATRPNYEEWGFETAAGALVLSNEKFDDSSLVISNPVKDELIIDGLTDKVNEVSIYNLVGELVLAANVASESSIKLNVSTLSSGVYVVKLISDNGSHSEKIVKE